MPRDSRIRILPEEAINKVAAGEVVERPAAALKELAENSLDAGAKKIEIDLERSGRGLIRVRDDGVGMTHDEVLLALERHSTSKITAAEDIEQVSTYGFRGEALPSLAAVSKVRITTRRRESNEGTRVVIESGRVLKVSPCGAPPGTEVEVRGLFRNIPARLKFLKSNATELSHCLSTVTRLALARPETAFHLSHGTKTILRLPAAADRKTRLEDYLGREFASVLLSFEADDDPLFVEGFVSPPGGGRTGRDYQQIFVNERPVRDPLLMKILRERLREFLAGGKSSPSLFLWIRIPPDRIDVNVHPTKREIRFRDIDAVASLVGRAITGALRRERTATFADRPPSLRDPVLREDRTPYEGVQGKAEQVSLESLPFFGESPGSAAPLPSGTQLFSTYIAALRENGLVLVDQHAAHERVLYEQALQSLAGGAAQTLLHPITVDVSPAESEILADALPQISGQGVGIEQTGPCRYRLTSLPLELPEDGAAGFVRDLVESIRSGGGVSGISDFRRNLAALIACHGSVRANQKLDERQIRRLLRDLFSAADPEHCPHGRPTYIRIGREEIEKRFKRT